MTHRKANRNSSCLTPCTLIRDLGIVGLILGVLGVGDRFQMTVANADTWRGEAPFCAGECLRGEQAIGISDFGDGAYCVTGHKVLCANRNPSPACHPGGPTDTTCYGVVMVCNEGCGNYACGPCFGLDDFNILSVRLGAKPGPAVRLPCQQGYVWREAYAGDYVCVPPGSRSRAAADNAQTVSRRVPGGGASGPDTCMQGFVWREAVPSDHVCVEPAVRSETAQENKIAAERTIHPIRVINDTCKQGYVWREAIANDHVCVTPATRTQASQDNSVASQRHVSGNDTCISGYVWREVIPSDHVCVTPDVRAAARADAAAAHTRLAK